MNVKKWYQSRTLWVNTLAFVSFLLQHFTGKMLLSLELQGLILTVLNMLLRLDTDSALE